MFVWFLRKGIAVRAVYKYPIGTVGEDRLSIHRIPAGAVIRCVAQQDLCPCIWMEVQTDAPKVDRGFRIFGTGHPIPEDFGYVGTTFDGPFVLHIYEWHDPSGGISP